MKKKSAVIWFTGLPCSGKTTLALGLEDYLKSKGHSCCVLDGDELRAKIGNQNFSEEARSLHVSYVGLLASELENNGIITIVSLVSPLNSMRRSARGLCKNFIEIYLNPPLKVCEERDVKGHYRKARLGQIQNFTGVDAAYEAPDAPEISLDTSSLDIQGCLAVIKDMLILEEIC
jgi:adenylylsulfate kinase